MRRDSEHVVRCVLADMTASVLAMAAAYWIRFRVMADGTPTEGPGALLLWAGAFSPAFPALYALLGVYSPGEGPDAPRRLGAMVIRSPPNLSLILRPLSSVMIRAIPGFCRRRVREAP